MMSRKTKPKTRLQERDLKILQFILEQKFASLEHIYFAFFDKRSSDSDPLPKNFWTLRQRLSKLRGAGLIKTQKVLSSSKGLYLITKKGKDLLLAAGFNYKAVESKRIDFSWYEHDYRVGMIRSFLIKRGKEGEFYSEKITRNNPIGVREGGLRLSKKLIPDAVFITKSNRDRVALEFELTHKSVRRIEDKIRLYEEYLGEMDSPKILDKVWVVAKTKSIARIYHKAIKSSASDGANYRVDLYEDVVPECAR